MSGSHLSKDFFEFVKSIGESRSKQEEDKIVLSELTTLKARMAAKDVDSKKMKEFLIRMIYVEMLGHDASFGHIHGVNLASSKNLMEKRVGYMAVSLTLHSEHSFMLLLINTIQRDLKSENYLEVSMGLTVVCKLVSKETIPALLPLVAKLLEHKEGLVKKKAVMAIHRFHQLDPSTVANLDTPIRKSLCDVNISVMGTSLVLFQDLCQQRPNSYKDLVPDFVSILKQVIEHRLPRDYDYHRVPAPWIQLKLLQILASLGAADKAASEGMYEILHEVMKRADIGINVGYAIVYECVKTVTSIYPDQSLIEDAALSISRFITSDNHNLKYLGVNALASIVQIDSKYAAEHQMIVIDLLEDTDETLKRKTLDLLYSMTNPANVTVIVDKMIQYLRGTTDVYLKTDLVSRINQLAEKFAPSNAWYVQTINDLFELGGSLLRSDVVHNLMKLIAESAVNAVDDPDADVRQFAVETYLAILQGKKSLPDVVYQVSAWVLGEFGHLSTSLDQLGVCAVLISCLDRPLEAESTRGWFLSAIEKLVAHQNPIPAAIVELMAKYQASIHVDLQQRAHEFSELAKTTRTMSAVLPLDSAHLDVSVDESLSFLNGYVDAALRAGAKPYKKRKAEEMFSGHSQSASSGHSHSHDAKEKSGLKFDAYAAPVSQINSTVDPLAIQFGLSAPSAAAPAATTAASEPDAGLRLTGVQKKWGPTGYNESDPAQAPAQAKAQPAPAPAPQPTVAAVPEPAPVKKPVKQEPPKISSEKEKLANSLFAGVGGAAAPAVAAVRKPTAQPVAARPAAAAPVQPVRAAPAAAAQPVDILGGILDALPTAPAPTVAQPAAAAGAFDLMQFASPGPAVIATPAPAPAASKGGDLLDLFGGAPLASPAPSAAPVSSLDPFGFTSSAPAASSDPSFLDFNGLSMSSSSPAAGFPVGSAAMSTLIQQQIGSLEHSPASELILVRDDRLQISAFKAFAEDATLVAVFITNKSNAALNGVTVALTVPNGLAVSASGDPIAPQTRPGSAANQLIMGFSSIASQSTTTALVSLACRDATFLSSPLAIAGVVQLPGQVAPSSFSIPLELNDFLRPAALTTAQYGGLWKQFTEEVKMAVRPSPVNSSPEFMNRMKAAHVHPVQTIGLENITAARLAGPSIAAGQALFVFVHGKVSATGGVDCIVRSKHGMLTQAMAKLMQSVHK